LCSGSTRRSVFRAVAFVLCCNCWHVPVLAQDSGQKQGEKSASSTDDAVYEPGGDVKPPKLVHYVEPAFSSSSKEAFVEGTVKISTVVTVEGKPSDSKVVKGLNAEEDRTAMEAVEQWRFEPGTRDGKAVKVRVNVEVDFHLM
jgi:TonB family protein